MAEIHSPDIFGPVALAGSAGTSGQRLTSAGVGAQSVWSTDVTVAPLDTASVDSVVTGGPAYVVSANVKISADAGNEASIHADGIYVPAGSGITVSDTSTIDLTLSANNISGTVKVSADSGNEISAHADGLYAAAITFGIFKGTSATNTTHTITHNLNNQFPDVTIYDTATNAEVIPATVVGTSVNVLTVTFFSTTAIAFTVVG